MNDSSRLRVRLSPDVAELSASTLAALVGDGTADKLVGGDTSLWGADAQQLAATRLGWLNLAETSRGLVSPLAELHAALTVEGIDRVVLAGMGGSSLAPEVICASAGVLLVALDTTDPAQVSSALVELERTVLVVSSKSGGTLETDSHHRAFRAAFTAAGIDPARRIVIVTDAGSPLEATAEQLGVRAIFRADPDVGGRYSALTAFGLVPSALAGVDVAALLDQAQSATGTLATDDGPGLVLGAALGAAAKAGRDKLVLADAGSGLPGFGDWAEQLIAESTGKQGRGILPVVVESPDAAGVSGDDRLLVLLGAEDAPAGGIAVGGPLGGLFVAWEFATAVAGRVLEIDPFDQPNVQESKDNTSALLDENGGGPLPAAEPAFADGPVQVFADSALLGGAATLPAAISALLGAVPGGGYVAVMAYLDRLAEAPVAGIRAALAARTDTAVTFGWAPRFLHSTGQYHKGGPRNGAFLQITATPDGDVAIPDRPFDFATLQAAQAAGDRKALASRDRPVLHLHLTDRAAGIAALLAAAEAR